MIYTNSITNAVFTILSQSPDLIGEDAHVENTPIMNTDPNVTPWVGIYSPTVRIEPRRSNVTNPWMSIWDIPVRCQVIGDNRETVINQLEMVTQYILTAVNSYRCLLDTVDIVHGFEVSPYQRNEVEEEVVFTNQINILAEVLT